jgi:gamma-tubulin complex component 2
MSSSSNVRPTTQTDRRSATDGATKPRGNAPVGGSRTERTDGRHPTSPQPSTGGAAHRRAPSGSHKTNRGIEERRTERVQVTTRETLTSRTRSPERRPAAPERGPSQRSRPVEGGKAPPGETRPRSSKGEASQGMAE